MMMEKMAEELAIQIVENEGKELPDEIKEDKAGTVKDLPDSLEDNNVKNLPDSIEDDSIDKEVKDFWDDIFSDTVEEDETSETENDGLTQEEKDFIKEETGWSDEIVDAMRNMDEYRIYRDAGLVEGEVNGKKCLMRTDIDWDQKDQFGYINRDRVSEGYAPLDKSGKPIQLHHIGQHADSPLAELTFKEHRTGGNDTILHNKSKKTEVHGEGNNWDNERKDYWRNRQPEGDGSNE